MKIYKVKVNGKVYEVELEAVEEKSGSIEVESKPASAPVSTGAGSSILAPIGGKLLEVKVKVGQTVNKGDVVCIIEAMKLENEVVATESGVVKEIVVSAGTMVANKDVLIILG